MGMGALGRAEDVKTRMKETGVDTKNRTDLVAKMPWAEQSFQKTIPTAQTRAQKFEVAGQSTTFFGIAFISDT